MDLQLLFPVLALSTLGSILGLVGGILMLANKKFSHILSVNAIPFAAGVMLAVSLLDILPEAIEETEAGYILKVVLIVMVLAFFFEKLFQQMHHNEGKEGPTIKSSLPLIVAGDTIHNFIDGLAIAAAYLVSPGLGILVAIATFLHELPHELGDFGVMIKAGLSRNKVILINLFSALATLAGSLLVVIFADAFEQSLGLLLGIAGGLFLYIALADLIPESQKENHDKPWYQAGLFLLGVIVIFALIQIFPHPHVE